MYLQNETMNTPHTNTLESSPKVTHSYQAPSLNCIKIEVMYEENYLERKNNKTKLIKKIEGIKDKRKEEEQVKIVSFGKSYKNGFIIYIGIDMKYFGNDIPILDECSEFVKEVVDYLNNEIPNARINSPQYSQIHFKEFLECKTQPTDHPYLSFEEEKKQTYFLCQKNYPIHHHVLLTRNRCTEELSFLR